LERSEIIGGTSPRGPVAAERAVIRSTTEFAEAQPVSGLERSDKRKGEPDHAASPLCQELDRFQRVRYP